MKALEQKIISECKILEGDVLKVDGFLNHQIDVSFMNELGKELYRLYRDSGVTKILTIEASGIGVACLAAVNFDPIVPVVFAKKHSTKNISPDLYMSKAESYTHGKSFDIVVAKEYLHENDVVLIIDDFLAKGNAMNALIDLCEQAHAKVAGVGIVIEKLYQDGGNQLRKKGVRVESLAKIASMSKEDGVSFES
ncbi:MAG: xanthine phosphoribosyltransferase [Ruminococcaceae bacterium]|nr:xanthine phosphoribosyltransferase [Oscillospiraceae bacterium]